MNQALQDVIEHRRTTNPFDKRHRSAKHELNEADDARNFDPQPAVFVKGIPKRHQRTILYVDENLRATRLLTFVLEGWGCKVVAACNSYEALAGLRQASCDLVLLAYRRPQTICSHLALEIKRLRPRIPIVLISGYSLLTPDELIHVNAHVGKGATLDDLLFKIQALIGQASARKSIDRRTSSPIQP